MNKTGIEYLDLTWNPTAGCSGLGCAVRHKCWAWMMAKRLGRYCDLCPSFVPHVHFDRFDEPLTRKKAAIIGTSFMGEFYDWGISHWVRCRIYMTMEKASWHTFIVFTKQPQNIDLEEPLPKNLWVGASVNCKQDLWRIDALRLVETSRRILSAEPLYEDLGKINLEGIGWLIIGAQTRPNLQPKKQWVDTLICQASAFDIPIFLKDNLGLPNPRQEFPEK